MKAIILLAHGSVENLIQVELPIPELQSNEVLIKVRAIAINHADTYIRKKKALDYVFNGERPRILGWDISGTVVRMSSDVTTFSVSDEVFGLIKYPAHNQPGHAKGYAEYVVAPVSDIALKPTNISHEEAAAATLAALAAWQPLIKAGLKKDDRIFITTGGGGVGHFAIQMAKYFGAYVIAQSSSAKREFVLSLGADEHVNYENQQFEKLIEPVDFVLEALRGDHIKRSLQVIKPGGTLISLWNMIRGTTWEIIAKEKKVIAWYNEVKSNGQDMMNIADLLSQGVLRPVVSKTYRLDQIREAHLEIEKDHTKGKIVISLR